MFVNVGIGAGTALEAEVEGATTLAAAHVSSTPLMSHLRALELHEELDDTAASASSSASVSVVVSSPAADSARMR
jgi:hypothetical protein